MATVSKARFTEEQKEAGQCQLFVESLLGSALTWFSRLPPDSIESFAQLSTAFLRNYRVFIERGSSSAKLWEIVQESGEPLRLYLTRFKEKYVSVSVTEDVAIAAFKKGLILGSPLEVDLNIRKAKDLDDALHRGSRFAYVEEDEEKDPKRGVVSAILEDGGQVNTPPDTQEEPFCNFHMFGGHSKAECKHLSNYLYEKYLSGEIKATYQPKAFRGGRGGRGRGGRSGRPNPGRGQKGNNHPNNMSSEQQQPLPVVQQHNIVPTEELPGPPKRQKGQQAEQTPTRGRISMIIGQTDECKDSVRALKKRVRQICSVRAISEEESLSADPITFTTGDAKGIHHPHNDPLVVEVTMYEFDVERVLVDTDSTVNVLFW
ncbi:PREDICTED: uncharacterized protein LOC104783979 [Camelina sativa]|uniref:Uncharacterized protein LOC104783979 n=1 Tax=Camelina sativa TaxID=90675 RepID=A0ABM0YXC9_CAMSA|nr:PREDICTED: uncharacterized protein LOC104783979 [Camelina sativa]